MKQLLLLLILFVLFSSLKNGREESLDNNEYEVKAAFIYNFTKYIEWENTKESSTFNISIYDESPIEEYLKASLKDKKVDNKKVEISEIEADKKQEIVHILFIPESVPLKEFKACVQEFKNKNTLIISEKSGRLDYGSCINFLVVSNKIKFEINLNALKKNNLKASSQLLKLAERIEQ